MVTTRSRISTWCSLVSIIGTEVAKACSMRSRCSVGCVLDSVSGSTGWRPGTGQSTTGTWSPAVRDCQVPSAPRAYSVARSRLAKGISRYQCSRSDRGASTKRIHSAWPSPTG